MKDWIIAEDVGKLFRRTTMKNRMGELWDTRYLRVRGFEGCSSHLFYRCDIIVDYKGRNYVNKNVEQTNLHVYRYEEVSQLEVLVLCGVEL